MPAYNEEGCIKDVVKKWISAIDGLGLESGLLIVVNDGSKDRTGAMLDEAAKTYPKLVVVHQTNGGHGKALRTAYDKAVELGAQWVFHVDSDDQFDSAELAILWNKRSQSNFILGFRRDRHDAFHRLVITRILRVLNFVLFGSWLRDSNIPFRLIQGDYLKILLGHINPTVFAPNIFLAVLAARDGQDLMAIPITHRERETGTVSIVRWRLIKACLRCVRELIDFRLALPSALKDIKAQRAALNLRGR
ncbi:MAG: glycosyltransferase family 2 protein [Deltaproteobacteria bacterium]|nr:glycosyltransferase family 2 protein [Deltaproteobacteria bacterium]